MRIPYLALYNAAVAVVCAGSVALAYQAHDRAAAKQHWKHEAQRLEKQAVLLQARDEAAVARYQALNDRFAVLATNVAASEKKLAAEISKTRTMKRKVVTGATVVSYVPG